MEEGRREGSSFPFSPPQSLFPFPFALATQASDGLLGHAQLEIQAESERLLANARLVQEVESSSTFSRPE